MYDIPIQLNWLEKDIARYEAMPLETGKILFYGHSLFTRWSKKEYVTKTLEEMILGKNGEQVCLNHGFGTSTSEELLYYYDRLVRPYKPKVLVVMTFANDGMYGYSAERTMDNVAKLCHWARVDFPGIPIFLVKTHLYGKYTKQPDKNETRRQDKFNQMLDVYADTHENVRTITLQDKPMFYQSPEDIGDYTKIRRDIFADNIHLNGAGYELFKDIFIEELKDYL